VFDASGWSSGAFTATWMSSGGGEVGGGEVGGKRGGGVFGGGRKGGEGEERPQ
jgi:hypothetical protein